MIQDWWNDIVRWAGSSEGWRIITGAILPFIAILAAGLIAGLIARGSTKRLIAQQDRQHKAAAVASLLAAGRKAATWSTLSASEKDHVDHQASEAEVRVRLLPVDGAALAADWAAHHLATLRQNSANFSFQAEQDLADLQDGLIAWQNKPAKARRLFAQDLAAWKYETPSAEDELTTKQREWAASQQTEAVPVTVDR
ncbi:hypothetical protein PYV02_05740 [Leifsonia sp. H3M29-4]|uniref:hypothetical protein n=1 Tax=Salinibacterium metalliresistens TaxID=3031321 RepID=UPI0023DA6F49|nr:hypothetical protein [Salinibacterium metalliresistens]MDF1478583.1 hypothetical protein [Salinibacterium metalliresistens]